MSNRQITVGLTGVVASILLAFALIPNTQSAEIIVSALTPDKQRFLLQQARINGETNLQTALGIRVIIGRNPDSTDAADLLSRVIWEIQFASDAPLLTDSCTNVETCGKAVHWIADKLDNIGVSAAITPAGNCIGESSANRKVKIVCAP